MNRSSPARKRPIGWPGWVALAAVLHVAAPPVVRGRAAEPAGSSGGVSLSQLEAVKKAVARHPVVKAAEHATDAARAKAGQAQTGWLPRIKLEAGYMLIGPVQEFTIEQEVDLLPEPMSFTRQVGSLHNAAVGLTVAWRAYDFGARDMATDAARAAAEASRAEGKEKAAQVAYAVRSAYLAALLSEEVGQVTRRSLEVARQEQTEERVKLRAGVGSELAVARISTRVAELGSRLTQARQDRERALVTLRLLLGLEPGTAIQLTDSLAELARQGELGKRGAAGQEGGPGDHPTRKRLRALEQASRLQLKQQWRAYWPTLDVMGSVKYQYPKNYFEHDRWGLNYQVGVQLTWNVFDGDLLRRKRQESRAQVARVESMAAAADEDIQRQRAEALVLVRKSQASVAAALRARRAAEIYLRAARAAKRAGTGTGLEVRKAEEAVDRSNLAEIKAYFDGARARASYLLALGRVNGK